MIPAAQGGSLDHQLPEFAVLDPKCDDIDQRDAVGRSRLALRG